MLRDIYTFRYIYIFAAHKLIKMKRNLLLLLPAIAIAVLLSSFGGKDTKSMSPGGAPAKNTGSPGDGQNCTHCHGGSATTVQGWITSDIGAEGYTPGQTYTITATATGSGRKGFEVSPQDLTGNLLGTLTAGSGNKLTGSGKYVTQSSASTANPKAWVFQWTAPAAGTGDVTFYGAFAITTSATKLSTLLVHENTTTGIPENKTGLTVKVYPNPVSDNMTVSFSLDENAQAIVSLVNTATGTRTVLSSENLSQGDHDLHFNCSNQASGMYVLQIEAGKQLFQSKVLIRR
jgi:hypothetical protein